MYVDNTESISLLLSFVGCLNQTKRKRLASFSQYCVWCELGRFSESENRSGGILFVWTKERRLLNRCNHSNRHSLYTVTNQMLTNIFTTQMFTNISTAQMFTNFSTTQMLTNISTTENSLILHHSNTIWSYKIKIRVLSDNALRLFFVWIKIEIIIYFIRSLIHD